MRNFIGLSVLVLLSAACSQSVFDPGASDGGDSGTNPVNGGGGADGGTPEASVPPGCDATKLPSDDFCVVNDGEGVFASTSLGSGMNDGTKAHPLGSLDAAIKLAKQSGKRVYACAEIYAEQIHIENGVSVFGNLSCNGGIWALSPAHAKVSAPASPAASAANVTSPTRIEAVDLVAPSFTTDSQSSIGLFANNAPGLYVAHATIHAGTGGKGADGTNGIQLTDSGSAKNGQDSWADGVCTGSNCTILLGLKTGQPAGGTNTCVGESGHDGEPGGAGGHPGEFQSQFFVNGFIWNAIDQGTTAGFPTAPTTQTAQGGNIGIGGSSGAPGAAGTNGFSGTDFGTLTASGYLSADGTKGIDGAPGQGGGGSGGYNGLTMDGYNPGATQYQNKTGWGEPGAGGGAGGCPGLAATAGKGGGASFAVVALSSGFTLDNVTVESSKGGDGGAAGTPSLPTAGGFGGKPAAHTIGGGNGGAGGHAGVSGNGGGGPSIGIVFDKTKPTLLGSKVTQGAGGAGVTTAPASLDGRSADVYQFGL